MKIYCLYGHGKDTERSYWSVVVHLESFDLGQAHSSLSLSDRYVKGKYEHSDANSEGDNLSVRV